MNMPQMQDFPRKRDPRVEKALSGLRGERAPLPNLDFGPLERRLVNCLARYEHIRHSIEMCARALRLDPGVMWEKALIFAASQHNSELHSLEAFRRKMLDGSFGVRYSQTGIVGYRRPVPDRTKPILDITTTWSKLRTVPL